MREQQRRDESELRDGKVRGVGSVAAFASTDSHAHSTLMDHAHVIGAVTCHADIEGEILG